MHGHYQCPSIIVACSCFSFHFITFVVACHIKSNISVSSTSATSIHTSANPTGPFHMGRARNPIIGDSVARLLNYYGHDVDTEYYVNDTGRQAATLAYGIGNYESNHKGKVDHDLVECYRNASEELKNNPDIRTKIYTKMELIESGNKEALNEVKKAAKKSKRKVWIMGFSSCRVGPAIT